MGDGLFRLKAWIRHRDVAAGLCVLALGAAVVTGTLGLRIGTPTRMGAGFLPLALGLLLGVAALALIAQGTRNREPLPPFVSLRPLAALTSAFVVFAVLVEAAGLMLASASAVILASFATAVHGWRETLLYAAGLTAFAALLFVGLLELPFTLWP